MISLLSEEFVNSCCSTGFITVIPICKGVHYWGMTAGRNHPVKLLRKNFCCSWIFLTQEDWVVLISCPAACYSNNFNISALVLVVVIISIIYSFSGITRAVKKIVKKNDN